MPTPCVIASARWLQPRVPCDEFHEFAGTAEGTWRQLLAKGRRYGLGLNLFTQHPNQSLIKHPDIKNSVRDGIVPIGELLVSRLENENPIYGADSVPFLATSYDEAKKLYAAQKPMMEEALAKDGLKLLFSVPWPPQGLYTKQAVDSVAARSAARPLRLKSWSSPSRRVSA